MANFDIKQILRKNIRDLQPYSSARDEFKGDASVFLDANENPFNSGINRYPDPLQQQLKTRIAQLKNVKPEEIFLGNGSDEAIDLLIRAFCEPGIDNIVSIKPTYGMYKVCADINNSEYREALLNSDFELDAEALLRLVDYNTKLLFLCSPNNPSGNSLDTLAIQQILDSFKGIVVLDEAYIDFSAQKSFLAQLETYPNLVILQTFSKAWGMAGIRLGMAFASAELIGVLNRIKYPYNINILTQQRALETLIDSVKKDEQVQLILSERKRMVNALSEIRSIEKIFPSDANFILAKVSDARKIYNYLLGKGIIVRDRSKVSLCENSLRITIGTGQENENLISELKKYFNQ